MPNTPVSFITMTLSLTSPPELFIFAPSSPPNTSKASGITAFEKPPPLTLSITSLARTLTILFASLLTDFFLKEGRMTVETVHILLMKLPMKEPISGAKSFQSPMNRWPIWEHTNASNMSPNISIGCLREVISKTILADVTFARWISNLLPYLTEL